MSHADWLAQPSEERKTADPEARRSIVYEDQADMEVQDYADFGPRLYLLLGSDLVLFLWRLHPERRLTYGLLLSFCLHWAYWEAQQKAAYTAHVRMYGQLPPHCRQGYNLPWTSVSGDNIEVCEAYRRLIAAAPLPVVSPLFEVAELVDEVFLELLGTIGTALYWLVNRPRKICAAFVVLGMVTTVFVLAAILADDFMRPQ
ncbi:hypothetical protein V5799_021625 [Amblyomma americanum]|uniref:Uncharacterized protein n=1 Tax=Amblyomma americanum TaxID=6943 RepID=A0AAQ4FMS1_AMBAM